MTSFTRKKIRLTITLANGSFSSGGNTLTLEGLRVISDIEYAGGQASATAQVRVYGMLQADMDQLTTLAWSVVAVARNTIRIDAGDDESGLFEAYYGNILNAWADYRSAPDVFMHIEAQSCFYDQVNAVAPSSYPGSADVSNIMSGLAKAMNLSFENNGVTVQLSNPYLPNTILEQVKQVAIAANLDVYIEGSVMAIAPKGGPRGTQVPVLSAETGLIGYPTIDRFGINLACLYNPAIRFGGKITVKSDMKKANGTWRVYTISHHLESERPDGAWFSQIAATEPGNAPIVAN